VIAKSDLIVIGMCHLKIIQANLDEEELVLLKPIPSALPKAKSGLPRQ